MIQDRPETRANARFRGFGTLYRADRFIDCFNARRRLPRTACRAAELSTYFTALDISGQCRERAGGTVRLGRGQGPSHTADFGSPLDGAVSHHGEGLRLCA